MDAIKQSPQYPQRIERLFFVDLCSRRYAVMAYSESDAVRQVIDACNPWRIALEKLYLSQM